MKIITKNDSVQQISIFDSKNLIAYSSVNKFILDSNLITNIAKSDFIKFNYLSSLNPVTKSSNLWRPHSGNYVKTATIQAGIHPDIAL